MARLSRGPNGPPSGKFGSVIGSSWRGIFYIKGLQKISKKTRSPLQVQQQEKFAFVVKFLKPVKQILDMGFSLINPGGATGYNMAISYTIQNCIKGSYPDFEIDYPAAVFCTKGKLSAPESITSELNGMKLKLNWSIETSISASSNDEVEILIHYPELHNFQISPDGITRDKGELEIELDTDFKGDTVHIYMYLMNIGWGKMKWSNSVYVGSEKLRE